MRKLLLSMIALVAIAMGAKAADPTYTAVGTVYSYDSWDEANYESLVNDMTDLTVEVYDCDSIVFRSWAGVEGYDLVAVLGANDSITSFHTLVNGKVYAYTAQGWSTAYTGAYPDKTDYWVLSMCIYSKDYAQISYDCSAKTGEMIVYSYGYKDSACDSKKATLGYYHISWSAASTSSSKARKAATRASSSQFTPYSYKAKGTISLLNVPIEGMRIDTLSSVVPVDSGLIGLVRDVTVSGDTLGCDSVFISDWWNYGRNGNTYDHTWDFGVNMYSESYQKRNGYEKDADGNYILDENGKKIKHYDTIPATIGQVYGAYYNYGDSRGWIEYQYPYTGSTADDSLMFYITPWSETYNAYAHYDNDAETKTGRLFMWGTLWNKGVSGYYYITWEPEDEDEKAKEVTITIGSEGIRTYSSGVNLDFASVSDYVKAYYAPTDTTGTITLKEVTGGVPAWEGLVLKSVNGGAITVSVPVAEETVAIDDNMLVPILQRKTVPYSSTGYYKFLLNDAESSFYKHEKYTVSEDHRAYMLCEVDLAAKNENGLIPIVFEDSDPSTGIKSVKAVKAVDDAYYTLSGVKVSKPTTKGIYVKNGKKVIVK